MKFLFYLLFITICVSFVNKAFAADAGKIIGKVIDAKTGEAVDFAIVQILSTADSTSIKKIQTDNGGVFSFTNIPLGNYRLKISFVGYVNFLSDQILLTTAKPEVNVGTVRLKQDATVLNEVTVTDTKPVVQFSADTITYNVSSSMLAQGSTATDLLKNVPMVDVDIDGKASIAGKRNTRIFIDGKPSDYVTSNIADLLNALPSDAIEKIEVITNPDVKYSADGEGIINIVLKKGYKIGLNGTISVNVGTKGSYNTNAYIAYRNEKLSVTSSYGYRNIQNKSNSKSLTQNLRYGNLSSLRNVFNDGKNVGFGHNVRSGIDWDITKKQNLRISINGNFTGSDGNSYSNDHRLNALSVEQEYSQQSNLNTNNAGNYVLNADYRVKLSDKNDNLELSVSTGTNSSNPQRSFERNYPVSTIIKTPVTQLNSNDISNKGLDFKADYSKPLNKLSTIALGFQTSLHTNDNDQLVKGHDYYTNIDTVNNQLTNRFKFFENIYAAYASYNKRTKSKWSFRTAARMEYTAVSFKQTKISDQSLQPYFNIFPNLSINKTIKKIYNLGANYSMRINRPRDYALNPLIDSSSASNKSFGNPGLKPSYTHQFELSFGTYGKKWSISPRVSYANTLNIIERIRTAIDTLGNYETTYKNLSSSSAYNFNLYGNYRPTKKITTNAGFSLSRIAYNSKLSSNANKSGLSYRSNVGLSIQLPKKIAFESNLNYYNNKSAQGRNKGSISSSFGALKVLFNNKLNVRLLVTDPFTQQNYIEFIETSPGTTGYSYQQQRYSKLNTQNYGLSLSYRFAKVGRNSVNKQKKDSPPED